MSSDWHKSIQVLLDFPVQICNMLEIRLSQTSVSAAENIFPIIMQQRRDY